MIDPLCVGVTKSTESEFEVFALVKVSLESFDDERRFRTLGHTGQPFEAFSGFLGNSDSLAGYDTPP